MTAATAITEEVSLSPPQLLDTTQEQVQQQQQQQDADIPSKTVSFNDNVEVLPDPLVRQITEESDGNQEEQEEDPRWFSPAEISSFREDAIRLVQALNALGGDDSQFEEDDRDSLRGLEKKFLKRPPPNFVRSLLRLQAYHHHQQQHSKYKHGGGSDLSTSLQLFSIASSKWARKRALQLAAEDEYDAYHIFMAGLRQYGSAKDGSAEEEEDDDLSDNEDDFADFCEDEDFDFCTEGDFVAEGQYVNNVYDMKHSKYDLTEDETEYDDSYGDEAFDLMLDRDADRLDLPAV